jgi:hypothetical protein
LYGFATKEEVIGKTGVELELITEADSNVNEIALNNTFVKDFKVKLKAKTGKELCISASLLNIEIDNTPCIVVVSVDITERKSRRALKGNECAAYFENDESNVRQNCH